MTAPAVRRADEDERAQSKRGKKRCNGEQVVGVVSACQQESTSSVACTSSVADEGGAGV